jgi:predicted DNA-binding protein (MmcQ/YjbR family)
MKTLKRESGPLGKSVVESDPQLSKRTNTVKAWLDAKPGAAADNLFAGSGSTPVALIYKVAGKIFAILSVRRIENVILKCDPQLATMLRERYNGIGHRSHLDRRYWISVTLDADVPSKEIRRLVTQSYDLVCIKLTRKQKAELARLASRRTRARDRNSFRKVDAGPRTR